MKKFDAKSILVGFIIGTVGITTVFAASGIKSASLSSAKVTVNGASFPLDNSLISIVKNGEENASLYMPVRELLEKLGYIVNWDSAKNTINIVPNVNKLSELINTKSKDESIVFKLKNTNTNNISESGSFQVEDNQLLTLSIKSIFKGTVDLFLFDPNGKEQRITIDGVTDTTKEITLSKGVWKYNCTGVFENNGMIQITGYINK